MALEFGKLHEALVAAGASESLARAAAEEVAAYHQNRVPVPETAQQQTSPPATQMSSLMVDWMLSATAAMEIVIFIRVILL